MISSSCVNNFIETLEIKYGSLYCDLLESYHCVGGGIHCIPFDLGAFKRSVVLLGILQPSSLLIKRSQDMIFKQGWWNQCDWDGTCDSNHTLGAHHTDTLSHRKWQISSKHGTNTTSTETATGALNQAISVPNGDSHTMSDNSNLLNSSYSLLTETDIAKCYAAAVGGGVKDNDDLFYGYHMKFPQFAVAVSMLGQQIYHCDSPVANRNESDGIQLACVSVSSEGHHENKGRDTTQSVLLCKESEEIERKYNEKESCRDNKATNKSGNAPSSSMDPASLLHGLVCLQHSYIRPYLATIRRNIINSGPIFDRSYFYQNGTVARVLWSYSEGIETIFGRYCEPMVVMNARRKKRKGKGKKSIRLVLVASDDDDDDNILDKKTEINNLESGRQSKLSNRIIPVSDTDSTNNVCYDYRMSKARFTTFLNDFTVMYVPFPTAIAAFLEAAELAASSCGRELDEDSDEERENTNAEDPNSVELREENRYDHSTTNCTRFNIRRDVLRQCDTQSISVDTFMEVLARIAWCSHCQENLDSTRRSSVQNTGKGTKENIINENDKMTNSTFTCMNQTLDSVLENFLSNIISPSYITVFDRPIPLSNYPLNPPPSPRILDVQPPLINISSLQFSSETEDVTTTNKGGSDVGVGDYSTGKSPILTSIKILGLNFGALGRGVWVYESCSDTITHIHRDSIIRNQMNDVKSSIKHSSIDRQDGPFSCIVFPIQIDTNQNILWDDCQIQSHYYNDTDKGDHTGEHQGGTLIDTHHENNKIENDSNYPLHETGINSVITGDNPQRVKRKKRDQIGEVPSEVKVTFIHYVRLAISSSYEELAFAPFVPPPIDRQAQCCYQQQLLTIQHTPFALQLRHDTRAIIEEVFTEGCKREAFNPGRLYLYGWEYLCDKFDLGRFFLQKASNVIMANHQSQEESGCGGESTNQHGNYSTSPKTASVGGSDCDDKTVKDFKNNHTPHKNSVEAALHRALFFPASSNATQNQFKRACFISGHNSRQRLEQYKNNILSQLFTLLSHWSRADAKGSLCMSREGFTEALVRLSLASKEIMISSFSTFPLGVSPPIDQEMLNFTILQLLTSSKSNNQKMVRNKSQRASEENSGIHEKVNNEPFHGSSNTMDSCSKENYVVDGTGATVITTPHTTVTDSNLIRVTNDAIRNLAQYDALKFQALSIKDKNKKLKEEKQELRQVLRNAIEAVHQIKTFVANVLPPPSEEREKGQSRRGVSGPFMSNPFAVGCIRPPSASEIDCSNKANTSKKSITDNLGITIAGKGTSDIAGLCAITGVPLPTSLKLQGIYRGELLGVCERLISNLIVSGEIEDEEKIEKTKEVKPFSIEQKRQECDDGVVLGRFSRAVEGGESGTTVGNKTGTTHPISSCCVNFGKLRVEIEHLIVETNSRLQLNQSHSMLFSTVTNETRGINVIREKDSSSRKPLVTADTSDSIKAAEEANIALQASLRRIKALEVKASKAAENEENLKKALAEISADRYRLLSEVAIIKAEEEKKRKSMQKETTIRTRNSMDNINLSVNKNIRKRSHQTANIPKRSPTSPLTSVAQEKDQNVPEEEEFDWGVLRDMTDSPPFFTTSDQPKQPKDYINEHDDLLQPTTVLSIGNKALDKEANPESESLEGGFFITATNNTQQLKGQGEQKCEKITVNSMMEKLPIQRAIVDTHAQIASLKRDYINMREDITQLLGGFMGDFRLCENSMRMGSGHASEGNRMGSGHASEGNRMRSGHASEGNRMRSGHATERNRMGSGHASEGNRMGSGHASEGNRSRHLPPSEAEGQLYARISDEKNGRNRFALGDLTDINAEDHHDKHFGSSEIKTGHMSDIRQDETSPLVAAAVDPFAGASVVNQYSPGIHNATNTVNSQYHNNESGTDHISTNNSLIGVAALSLSPTSSEIGKTSLAVTSLELETQATSKVINIGQPFIVGSETDEKYSDVNDNSSDITLNIPACQIHQDKINGYQINQDPLHLESNLSSFHDEIKHEARSMVGLNSVTSDHTEQHQNKSMSKDELSSPINNLPLFTVPPSYSDILVGAIRSKRPSTLPMRQKDTHDPNNAITSNDNQSKHRGSSISPKNRYKKSIPCLIQQVNVDKYQEVPECDLVINKLHVPRSAPQQQSITEIDKNERKRIIKEAMEIGSGYISGHLDGLKGKDTQETYIVKDPVTHNYLEMSKKEYNARMSGSISDRKQLVTPRASTSSDSSLSHAKSTGVNRGSTVITHSPAPPLLSVPNTTVFTSRRHTENPVGTVTPFVSALLRANIIRGDNQTDIILRDRNNSI